MYPPDFAIPFLGLIIAITRPIDTLYIKLGTPTNEFSQRIVEIGKKCGVEILSDPIMYNSTDDLPF